jgi:hypothetical protein
MYSIQRGEKRASFVERPPRVLRRRSVMEDIPEPTLDELMGDTIYQSVAAQPHSSQVVQVSRLQVRRLNQILQLLTTTFSLLLGS